MKLRELFTGRVVTVVGLLTALSTACNDQPPAFTENAEILDSSVNTDDLVPGQDGHNSGDPNSGSADQTGTNGNGSGAGGNGATLDSIEARFQATQAEQGKVVYDWRTDRLEQVLTLEHQRNEETMVHHQANRPQHTELFAQGSDEREGRETFTQNDEPSGLLDILVVVDNSPSMKEEQINLSTKLSPLLSYVQASDWRIGVVTTDPSDGCLRALINKNDADPSQAFENAVNAGIRGTGNEQGVRQAVAALQGTCQGSSWLRANSTLAVLIVSDEDNCSDGQGCGSNAWKNGSYLTNYLSSIRQLGVNAKVYGLIWHPSMTTQQCGTAINRAYIYGDVIAQTGGTFGAICDADYTPTLSQISQNLSVILESQFALQFSPLPGSLKVFVNGQLQTSGYSLTGNVITFTTPPPAGAEIAVEYSYFTQAPQSAFTLARAADQDSLEVYLDGQPAAGSDYEYDAANRAIRFFQAPIAREVKVVYLQLEGLLTDFAINGPVDPNSVSVLVNGELADQADYTIVNGNTLRFFRAPPDGAAIRVSYIKSDKPRYSYPMFLPETSIVSLEVFDELTLEPVQYTLNNRFIVIGTSEFQAGRNIILSYRSSAAAHRKIDIGYDVRNVVDVMNQAAMMCDPFVVDVNGSVIDLTSCQFNDGDRVNIRFQYISAHHTSFEVTDPRLGNGDGLTWAVFVNGSYTTEYVREGTTIHIPNLAYNAQVVIKVTFPASN